MANFLPSASRSFPVAPFLQFGLKSATPRNPSAINPYSEIEYVLSGAARLIFRRTRAKHASASQGQGEYALQVLGGWELDSDVEAILSKGWEPDYSFSIYHP